jgi:thiamine-phosphate pyrophosphorylase
MLSKLQYISQGESSSEHYDNIQKVLDAGVKWIQLRLKEANPVEILSLAEKVKNRCQSYQATFIVNDHVEIAKIVDADGVHVGLEDMPVKEVRKMLGENKIIGGTANTLQDVLERVNEKCSYIGLGPFRFTATKKKLSPVLGLEGYRQILETLHKSNIQFPVFAIGGITPDDIPALKQTGIYGVAMSSALTHCNNLKEIVASIDSIMN